MVIDNNNNISQCVSVHGCSQSLLGSISVALGETQERGSAILAPWACQIPQQMVLSWFIGKGKHTHIHLGAVVWGCVLFYDCLNLSVIPVLFFLFETGNNSLPSQDSGIGLFS